MKHSTHLPCARVVQLAVAVWFLASSSFAQTTHRVSLSSPGVQVSSRAAQGRLLSRDGRSAVFHGVGVVTASSILTSHESFVRRLDIGATELVTLDALGSPSGSGLDSASAISGDGRYVAFVSRNPNIVLPDAGLSEDVFVRDTWSGAIERVSDDAFGVPGGTAMWEVAISADGSVVGFLSWTAMIPGDTNNGHDVYVRDRSTNALSRVSVGVGGGEMHYGFYPLQQGGIRSIDMSADGRVLVFGTWAIDGYPNDTNNAFDTFCHDRTTGVTQLIGIDVSGAPPITGSVPGGISGDGRFVGFSSASPNLVLGVNSTHSQVYVFDRMFGTTELVSRSLAGGPGDEASGAMTISGDGRFVAFASLASNLVSNDTNGAYDVFLRDRILGTTSRVNVASDGSLLAASDWLFAGMSDDGSRVMFSSSADNVVPGDTNGKVDSFVRDLAIPPAPVTAYCSSKAQSNGCMPAISTAGTADSSGATAFAITATGVSGHRMAALAWSFAPAQPPFAPGLSCVASPKKLLPVLRTNPLSTTCDGWLAEPFSPARMASLGWTPGTTVYVQYLVRDSLSQGYAQSRGLSFIVH